MKREVDTEFVRCLLVEGKYGTIARVASGLKKSFLREICLYHICVLMWIIL